MKTTVRSEDKEAIISTDGPFTVIGEKINPTGRKKLAAALKEGDFSRAMDLARVQIEAEADILDVNVGVPGVDEAEVLPKLIELLVREFDVPLCLDSANPTALAAALEVAPGRPLVNSVTGEKKSMDAILPIVRDYHVPVIGLVMDDDGIPDDAESRLAVAESIIERAASMGIEPEDIVIDPLVLTVGADSQAGAVTLRTIELVTQHFGVNISLGASNVSFGLPDRHTLNQAFLGLAIHAGATCAITDPMKLTPIIRAADLLMGRDSFGSRYIRNYRKRAVEKEA